MVTIIRDRVQAMIDKGMTLDQVKAARPTADYEPRYGADVRTMDDRHVRGGGVRDARRRQEAGARSRTHTGRGK